LLSNTCVGFMNLSNLRNKIMIYTQKYTTKIDLNNKSHNNRKP